MNGDGLTDILVSWTTDWWYWYDTFVRVVSGADGEVLHELEEYFAVWDTGTGIGDSNGDGFDDFVIRPGKIYSGRDGCLLRSIQLRNAYAQEFADVNSDGLSDLIAGAESQNAVAVLAGCPGFGCVQQSWRHEQAFPLPYGLNHQAVAVWKDTLAVGSAPGLIQVYEASPAGWTQTADFYIASGHGGSTAVALEGDRLVGGISGACTVFEKSGAGWKETARLGAFGSEREAGFGRDVALSGDRVLVAAPFATVRGVPQSGRVRTFERFPSGWREVAEIPNPEPHPGALFGWSLDLHGDTAVVAASADEVGQDPELVYVFEYTSSGWEFVQELDRPNTAVNLGSVVDLQSDTLIVGAPISFSPNSLAFIYQRQGSSWSLVRQLRGDPVGTINFGCSVALSEDRAVVGAGSGPGAAFVYERDGGAWTQFAKIVHPGPPLEDVWFGYSVAVHGDRVLVTAPRTSASAALLFSAGELEVPGRPEPCPPQPISDR